MNILKDARSHAASNITSLNDDSITDANDIRDMLEENSYDGPEIIYYSDAWEICNDSDAPDPGEEPDFSNCKTARECATVEAQLIADTAYRNALDSILDNIQDAIDEIEGESDLGDLEGISLGGAGLDSQPHDEERDIADGGNLYIWRRFHRAELRIDGISLTFEYSDPADDSDE